MVISYPHIEATYHVDRQGRKRRIKGTVLQRAWFNFCQRLGELIIKRGRV